jgi:dCMP deaminase
MSSLKWDRRYMDMAKLISTWSKDPDKQVGAVITDHQYVRGVGFNGFPRGVQDTNFALHDKATKLSSIIHAEVNAVLAAQGAGETIYVYPCMPCPQCMGILRQAGIHRVVTLETCKQRQTKWNIGLSFDIAAQCGILVEFI